VCQVLWSLFNRSFVYKETINVIVQRLLGGAVALTAFKETLVNTVAKDQTCPVQVAPNNFSTVVVGICAVLTFLAGLLLLAVKTK
jgi:hypothetical protein